jgi:hypothetical protein
VRQGLKALRGQGPLVLLVRRVPKESRGFKGRRDLQVRKEIQGYKVFREKLDLLVLLDLKAEQGPKVFKDLPALRDYRGRQAIQGHRGPRASKARRGRQAQQASRESRDLKVLRVRQVPPGLRASRVFRVPRDQPGQLDPRDSRGSRGREGHRDLPAT